MYRFAAFQHLRSDVEAYLVYRICAILGFLEVLSGVWVVGGRRSTCLLEGICEFRPSPKYLFRAPLPAIRMRRACTRRARAVIRIGRYGRFTDRRRASPAGKSPPAGPAFIALRKAACRPRYPLSAYPSRAVARDRPVAMRRAILRTGSRPTPQSNGRQVATLAPVVGDQTKSRRNPDPAPFPRSPAHGRIANCHRQEGVGYHRRKAPK